MNDIENAAFEKRLSFDLEFVAIAIAQARGDAEISPFAREEAQAAIEAVLELQNRAALNEDYFDVSARSIKTPEGVSIPLDPGLEYETRSGDRVKFVAVKGEDSDGEGPALLSAIFKRFVFEREDKTRFEVRFDGRALLFSDGIDETEMDIVSTYPCVRKNLDEIARKNRSLRILNRLQSLAAELRLEKPEHAWAPKSGSRWRHTNGNSYTVLGVVNLDASGRPSAAHPPHVIYFGENARIWSRAASDWRRSMTPLDPEPDAQNAVENASEPENDRRPSPR